MFRMLLVLALTASSAFGQGYVIFSNYNGGQPVYDGSTGAPAAAGTFFRAGLYFGLLGSQEETFVQIGLPVYIGPAPGFFSGGFRTILQIRPAGGFGLFQVRGWSAAYGTTYEAVIASGDPAALAGKSNVFEVDTADPTGSPAQAPIPIAPYMQSFTLTPVPEPGVIGLSLLGGVALLVICRRKAE